MREIRAVQAASAPEDRRRLLVSLPSTTLPRSMVLFYGDPEHPDGILPPSTGETFAVPGDGAGCLTWKPSAADRAASDAAGRGVPGPPADTRYVARAIALALVVPDVEGAMTDARAIAARLGGAAIEGDSAGVLIVTVPRARFDGALKALLALGKAVRRGDQSADMRSSLEDEQRVLEQAERDDRRLRSLPVHPIDGATKAIFHAKLLRESTLRAIETARLTVTFGR